jgi:hypothetical protein
MPEDPRPPQNPVVDQRPHESDPQREGAPGGPPEADEKTADDVLEEDRFEATDN